MNTQHHSAGQCFVEMKRDDDDDDDANSNSCVSQALDIFLLVVGQLAGRGRSWCLCRLGLKLFWGGDGFAGDFLGALGFIHFWSKGGLGRSRMVEESWLLHSEKALVDYVESSEACRPSS